MSKKKTNEEFIEDAKKIHSDKYDYSLTDYKNSYTDVIIICPIHSEFPQSPNSHLSGRGCPYCYGTYKKTTEEFIEDAKKIHGDKYDYSLVDYKGNKINVVIICPIHSEFPQKPTSHLKGSGCSRCSSIERVIKKTRTTEKFIKEAKKIHGDRYNYSLVNYKKNKIEVIIICKEHGEFPQTPMDHLRNVNCPNCSKCKKLTKEEFVEKANIVHNNKYDYSLVDYKGSEKIINIICKEHGPFEQSPYSHLKGHRCKRCNGYEILNTFDFIKKSKEVHNDKYDYSLVNYINSNTIVRIICKKHSEFPQLPKNHIYNKQGCPICSINKNELLIKKILNEQNIKYEHQKSFKGCRYIKPLRFDFYLPDYNICIEFDGKQHYELHMFFGGEKEFTKRQIRDQIKTDFCLKNNIELNRIKYNENIEEKLSFIFS